MGILFQSVRRCLSRRSAVAAGLALAILVGGCARPAAPPVQTPTAVRVDRGVYQLSAYPSQFLLAGEGVLFTAAESPAGGGRHLYRLDLATGEVREVLHNRFLADGTLDSYRLGLAGDWLVYLETSAQDNGRSWTLAAQNLATGEAMAIDQAVGDEVGWPGPEVAADGDWVVWARREATGEGPRSRIHARNLKTGEQKALAEPLDATQEVWGWPDLQEERLVVERDELDPQSPSAGVALIDLATGKATSLSGPEPASEPSCDGRYVAWKAGLRYGRGRLVVYDLERREARTLDLEAEYPHVDAGRVLAWVEGSGWVQVDPADGSQVSLVEARQDAASQPGREVALDGARTAWVETAAGAEGSVRLHVVG